MCAALQDLFPDSVSVRAVGLGRSDDREIWKYAEADCYVLVSQDADFAEMAALLRPGPKVIWLRTGNQPTHATEQTLRRHADAILAFAQNDARCLEIY